MKTTLGKNVNMLSGPLASSILLFAIPLAVSSILQQLFNAVDVAVLGHFASSEAMAAAGSNSPVINLIVNLFTGLSIGANVVIANHVGQRSEEGIRSAVATAAVVAIVSGAFLAVFGMVVARPILEFIGTPAEIIDMATTYLRIYFWGMPFILAFNFGAAILRSVGDTRRPLVCLVVGGVVNVVLNVVLVVMFDMSVVGVAVATVVANGVSAAMLVSILVHEKGAWALDVHRLRVVRSELVKMFRIGIPTGIQGMVFSISNVAIQSTINGFGPSAMAGSAVTLNYEQFCYFVMSSFCGAATTFIGQNYGAGQHDRCRRVYRDCMLMSLVVCGVLNVLITWQNSFFISLFSTDPTVVHYAFIRMSIVLVPQFIASSYEVSGAALRGLGWSMVPAVLTIFGTCLLRLVWVFVVCPRYQTFDVLVAVYPVSWVVTGVMALVAYVVVSRRVLR